MQPVAVFRFSPTEGPAHFATFLEQRHVPWRLVALDAGEAVPRTLDGFSGVAMMGGPMSVNDPLPWVDPLGALLRAAVADDIPVIGHCLGGQMLAKALGVPVSRAPNVEIGWHDVRVEDTALAHEWFGDIPEFRTFEWHNESFALPPGAARVLTNSACPNQAYVLGNSIGLQCHVEMTRELVELWVNDGVGELSCEPLRAGAFVQSAVAITRNLDATLAELHQVSDRIYTRWIAGLRG